MKRNHFFVYFVFTILLALPHALIAAESQTLTAAIKIQNQVQYPGPGGVMLKGYLYKPPGDGPFPAIIANHGSEKDPAPGQLMSKFWLDHNFVYFKPIRSGHGGNPGSYIVDQEKALRKTALERRSVAPQVIALHEKANDDVVAAFRWLKEQSFVDPKKIVISGGSYGGIQTLLTAERNTRENLGATCFIAFSPAAMSWQGNPLWATRLSQAIQNSKSPIYLVQAQNDFNLGPSLTLGPILDAKGGPNGHKVYPPYGTSPQEGHAGFFKASEVWGSDVLAFLYQCQASKSAISPQKASSTF